MRSNSFACFAGDTLINEKSGERLRLLCVNSPEVKTKEGIEASLVTNDYIDKSHQLIINRFGIDLYGRTLSTVINEEGIDLGQYLLSNKGAIYNPYQKKLCKGLYSFTSIPFGYLVSLRGTP